MGSYGAVAPDAGAAPVPRRLVATLAAGLACFALGATLLKPANAPLLRIRDDELDDGMVTECVGKQDAAALIEALGAEFLGWTALPNPAGAAVLMDRGAWAQLRGGSLADYDWDYGEAVTDFPYDYSDYAAKLVAGYDALLARGAVASPSFSTGCDLTYSSATSCSESCVETAFKACDGGSFLEILAIGVAGTCVSLQPCDVTWRTVGVANCSAVVFRAFADEAATDALVTGVEANDGAATYAIEGSREIADYWLTVSCEDDPSKSDGGWVAVAVGVNASIVFEDLAVDDFDADAFADALVEVVDSLNSPDQVLRASAASAARRRLDDGGAVVSFTVLTFAAHEGDAAAAFDALVDELEGAVDAGGALEASRARRWPARPSTRTRQELLASSSTYRVVVKTGAKPPLPTPRRRPRRRRGGGRPGHPTAAPAPAPTPRPTPAPAKATTAAAAADEDDDDGGADAASGTVILLVVVGAFLLLGFLAMAYLHFRSSSPDFVEKDEAESPDVDVEDPICDPILEKEIVVDDASPAAKRVKKKTKSKQLSLGEAPEGYEDWLASQIDGDAPAPAAPAGEAPRREADAAPEAAAAAEAAEPPSRRRPRLPGRPRRRRRSLSQRRQRRAVTGGDAARVATRGDAAPTRGGILAPLHVSGDEAGYLEMKLAGDGAIEAWLTGPDHAPLNIAATAFANADGTGAARLRDGKTDYFVFPGATGADAAWLAGDGWTAAVEVRARDDGRVLEADAFVLEPLP
ncbi:hypothetical protein JL721_5414 [Aureococcus anophagefferens]|nr:hypothetical protein JL721_5414 [Aureococcus anophagefferens]